MLTFVDLFCGVGGFHEAIRAISPDSKCLLACDIDKACCRVYQNNFGISPVLNIKEVQPNQLDDFDILCAGFPCQSFSNAGKKKTFKDDRGLLFDEIIRIVKEKRPKFMFLENVKHILQVDNGNVIEYIKNRIDDCGYSLQMFRMSPHNYGIPQQRERVYFVCVRKDIYDGDDIVLVNQENHTIRLEDFLDKEVADRYAVKDDLLDVLESWNEMIHVFEDGEKISPTIMIHEFYKTYDEEEWNALPEWKRDYITKNRPLYTKYKPQWDEWYAVHNTLLSKREIYGKLEWQVGKIKTDDDLFDYFIQIRQSGIRVKKTKYFPTLVAMSQIPIYGKEKRYITPRECFRLQSFPDTFLIDENDRISYKQAGNSVNVENVKNVILSTLTHYHLV